MTTPTILHIAVPTPLSGTFDYLFPSDADSKQPCVGGRVLVPFGRQKLVGIVMAMGGESQVPAEKLKPVIEVIDEKPVLSQSLLALCEWASDYYQYSIGEVCASCLPTSLRKGDTAEFKKNAEFAPPSALEPEKSLNDAQKKACESILKSKESFHVFLLDGITGSGKTEVYLQTIQAMLSEGKQALVLVPEISLTPQTLSRFQRRFSKPVVILHSGLNDRQRHNAWLSAQRGEAGIVIGTRSAIFTPMPKLGMIVIDEEHDISFKQQDGFRYSARDLAIIRAQKEQVPVILGSATPSLESVYNVERQRSTLLHLPERAGPAEPPKLQLVDIRGLRLKEGISDPLHKAMQRHLNNGHQVLVFLNRRGFAPSMICHHCGWVAGCTQCDAKLVVHQEPYHLHCHHCNARQAVPKICPACKAEDLRLLGVGTERVSIHLEKTFPETPIIRIDRDTTRKKGALHSLLDEIHEKPQAILVGTQMLAKGHHFPRVTLVVILDGDGGLFSGDFRASERMAQLMIQVAGRAGRAENPGEVWIQTRHPTHPIWNQLFEDGYSTFAKSILVERAEAGLPPYRSWVLLRAESKRKGDEVEFLQQAKTAIQPLSSEHLSLLGPIPSPMARRKGHHRAQLLCESSNRSDLQRFLSQAIAKIESIPMSQKIHWFIDVDPVDIF